MMNLPITITGHVIHGRSLGSTYDMPTANIIPKEDISALKHGVYFSVITIDGNEYPAITNLGVRPTVSDDGTVNAETFIFRMSDDIYDKNVSVRLLGFHRGEKKFASTDELFAAIREDILAGRHFHGV